MSENPLAFPTPDVYHPNNQVEYGQNGMTLRDYFAGQALALMAAAHDYSRGPCDFAIAQRAYCIADAMLEARNQTTPYTAAEGEEES